MPGTPTPIYGLVVPTVAGDQNAWGAEVNGDLAQLDTLIGLPRIKRAVVTTGLLDLAVANFHEMTVTAPVVVSFANVPSGTYTSLVTLKVINGGSNTITWPGTIVWLGGGSAPSLQAAGVDMLLFWTNDNGTTWYGSRQVTSPLPPYPQVLFTDFNKSTTSASDVSITSFLVPAGKLALNGQRLRIRITGVQSGGTSPVATVNPKFGATSLGAVSFPGGAILDISIVRTGATAQVTYRNALLGGSGSASATIVVAVPAETLSNAILFDVRGSTAGGGTLRLDEVLVEFISAT